MAPFSLSPISSPLLYISFFSSLPILFPIPSNSPNGNREAVKLRPITDRNMPRPYGPTYVSKQCKQKKKKRAKRVEVEEDRQNNNRTTQSTQRLQDRAACIAPRDCCCRIDRTHCPFADCLDRHLASHGAIEASWQTSEGRPL